MAETAEQAGIGASGAKTETGAGLRQAAVLLPAALMTPPAVAIAASMPDFHAAFAATPNADLWVRVILATPALFIVLFAPVAGYLADRIGRVPLLSAGALIYGLGGSAPLLLDSLPAIFGARALLGIGTGTLMVATTSLIGDLYQGEARAKVMGRQGALLAVGSIGSMMLGGALGELGWRAPHGLFLIALLLIPLFRVAFAGGVARSQPQQSAGSLPRGLMPAVIALFTLNLLSGAAYFVMSTQVPFRIVELGLERPGLIGLTIGATAAISVASAMCFKAMHSRWSPFTVGAFTYATIAAGYGMLALAPSVFWGVTGISIAMIGMGLFAPNIQNWLLSIVPEETRGRMVGTLTMTMFLGMFLSPLITQPIAGAFGLSAALLAVSAGLAGLVLVLLLLGAMASRRQ